MVDRHDPTIIWKKKKGSQAPSFNGMEKNSVETVRIGHRNELRVGVGPASDLARTH